MLNNMVAMLVLYYFAAKFLNFTVILFILNVICNTFKINTQQIKTLHMNAPLHYKLILMLYTASGSEETTGQERSSRYSSSCG
jgi:hypothetical protein